MKSEAGPSALERLPSRTVTSNVNCLPSNFGVLSTTTASSIAEPSLFSTDIVAFGGSLAKLSFPSSHCLMNSLVSTCPAALTGRSAKTIEFGAMLLIVNFPTLRLAPPELRTANDGTISALDAPIVFCAGAVIASWASATPAPHRRLARAVTKAHRVIVMELLLLSALLGIGVVD